MTKMRRSLTGEFKREAVKPPGDNVTHIARDLDQHCPRCDADRRSRFIPNRVLSLRTPGAAYCGVQHPCLQTDQRSPP